MPNTVKIDSHSVGNNHPCFVIAEIGINHNGDIELAKKLIDVAVESGAQAVKFQKRTIDVVYTAKELARPRENPFGDTNGDLKRGLEFGKDQFDEIDKYCKDKNVLWFGSAWDEASVDFLEKYNPVCYKIASASLTDDNLLRRAVWILGERHRAHTGIEGHHPLHLVGCGIDDGDCFALNRSGDRVLSIWSYVDVVNFSLYGDAFHVG